MPASALSPRCQRRSLLPLLLFVVFGSQESSASSQSSSASSPVRNLEPSWAASCAQSTAMAMAVDGHDSLLLVVRSPTSNVWKPSLSTTTTTSASLTISGLTVTPINHQQPVQFAPAWLPMGPHSLCAMTGLASDVEHLCRVLQQQVDQHANLFDRPRTTHAMVLGMAEVIRQATMSSRPYGVQTLLVGGDDVDPRRFGVYSIDPSGAWQSWGGTTVIGKDAKPLRKALLAKQEQQQQQQEQQQSTQTLQDALEQLIGGWMETCQTQSVKLHADDDWQVLVLKKESKMGPCQIYQVDQQEVQDMVERAVSAQTSK